MTNIEPPQNSSIWAQCRKRTIQALSSFFSCWWYYPSVVEIEEELYKRGIDPGSLTDDEWAILPPPCFAEELCAFYINSIAFNASEKEILEVLAGYKARYDDGMRQAMARYEYEIYQASLPHSEQQSREEMELEKCQKTVRATSRLQKKTMELWMEFTDELIDGLIS